MASKKVDIADALLTAAAALQKREIQQLGFDPLVAKRACRTGLETLDEYASVLVKGHKGFDLDELRALPTLCDLVLAAQRETMTLRKLGGDDAVLLSNALTWRRRLLGLAQSLAEKGGAVDPRELRKIESGKGPTDNVQDVIDLVKLLKPAKAAVEAAHGDDALAIAEATAREAIAGLGGTGGETPQSRKAADRRDRLATLVVLRHDRLRSAVAAVTSYRQAAALVPGLQEGPGGIRSLEEAPPTPS